MIRKPLKQFDCYRLMDIIGKGATADVYLSIDDKHNQLVAIKSMPKSKIKDEHGETNLRRELEILHKLKHKNIIGIKNYKETKKNHYIILDYCNGGDLESYCKNYKNKYKQPLNEVYIQKILQQFVSALEYMHKNNIIHRDIKLQNILLNFDTYPNVPKNGNLPPKLTFEQKSLNLPFSIKIADLGYAKDLMKDKEGSTILGSPMYMPPDIVEKYTDDDKANKKYNSAVDLWSLGVVTYELLTGTAPFLGNNVNEVFKNIKKGTYTLPKTLKPSVQIISFLNGLLQYYPEKRLNIEQVKSHPFLTLKPNEFNYIDLEMVTENEKDKIEMNSKNSDNLLWIFFKCKNLNMNIDKMNEKEVQKPEVKQMIDKNKVINEEVQKALEQEKIELEKEKEKNKVNSEENNKKLKELELKLQQIQIDKELEENKLKNVEQKISENEKIKKFTEKQINKIMNEGNNNINNENYKKELNKLHEEKIAKENEMKKLKQEQELKENDYKKENDKLQKKMDEISQQKKLLEKEVNQNNNTILEKIKNTNEQMENLQNELKKIEQQKQKQIQDIQNEKENLQKQIVEFSRIIKETEEYEKEKEKKGIFLSCIEINKEDVENESKKEEKEEKKEDEFDEWEEIGDKDLESNNGDNEDFEFEDFLEENGYELIEEYVDNETAKNEKK